MIHARKRGREKGREREVEKKYDGEDREKENGKFWSNLLSLCFINP